MRAHHHGEPASLPGMADTVHATVHSLPSGQLTSTYPPLPPLLDDAVAQLVQESPVVLHELVEQYGSPLNLVWPHLLGDNARKLTAVLRRHGVRHEVFYGAKVNKSQAFIHAAVQAGIGVDVSSLHEAADALKAGADPARLCATGPAKTRAFHELLIAQSALVSIDSRQELQDLEDCLRPGPPSRRATRRRCTSRPLSGTRPRHPARSGIGATPRRRRLPNRGPCPTASHWTRPTATGSRRRSSCRVRPGLLRALRTTPSARRSAPPAGTVCHRPAPGARSCRAASASMPGSAGRRCRCFERWVRSNRFLAYEVKETGCAPFRPRIRDVSTFRFGRLPPVATGRARPSRPICRLWS